MPRTSLEKGEEASKGPHSEGVKEKLDSLLETKYRFTTSGWPEKTRERGACFLEESQTPAFSLQKQVGALIASCMGCFNREP